MISYSKAEAVGKIVIDFINAGYEVKFDAPAIGKRDGYFMHFSGIDELNITKNFNINDYIKGENKIVVSANDAEQLSEALEAPVQPSEALQKLFKGENK